MACGVSIGKSGGWLERLRAARGFAEGDAADLQSPTQDDYPRTKANANPISPPPRNVQGDLRSTVAGVLNELFNFGDNNVASGHLKKSCRKQSNPKICTFSNDPSDGSKDGSLERAKQPWRSEDNGGRGKGGKQQPATYENEEEEGERDPSLTGFSRTDVTVIDTSYGKGVWKFEKLLFRKKNVWRVREKKGKSPMSVTKKRKRNADDVGKGRKAMTLM